MTRPLELKSPDHAGAIFFYTGLAFFGASILTGVAASRSLATLLPVSLVPIWGLLTVLSGLTCAVSALLARKASRPQICLRAEAAGAVGMAVCLYVYAASGFTYIDALGPALAPEAVKSVYSSVILFAILATGKLARTTQLCWELHVLRIARRHPTTVTHESLGDPNHSK